MCGVKLLVQMLTFVSRVCVNMGFTYYEARDSF